MADTAGMVGPRRIVAWSQCRLVNSGTSLTNAAVGPILMAPSTRSLSVPLA